MRFILVSILLGACVAKIEGIKCDPFIEGKIKALWSSSKPLGTIETAISNGKAVVVSSTKNYFRHDVKCVFSVFSKESYTSIWGLQSGCPVINTVSLKDIEGGAYEPGSKTYKLTVYQKGGVTGFYKCIEDGADGDPEGLITVSASLTEDYSALVKEAKEVFSKLGINIETDYPSTCP